VAGGRQRLARVAADVPGPAGDEDRFGLSGQWRSR
jgi:hypothetical protein